jgi:hypothetical protein
VRRRESADRYRHRAGRLPASGRELGDELAGQPEEIERGHEAARDRVAST